MRWIRQKFDNLLILSFLILECSYFDISGQRYFVGFDLFCNVLRCWWVAVLAPCFLLFVNFPSDARKKWLWFDFILNIFALDIFLLVFILVDRISNRKFDLFSSFITWNSLTLYVLQLISMVLYTLSNWVVVVNRCETGFEGLIFASLRVSPTGDHIFWSWSLTFAAFKLIKRWRWTCESHLLVMPALCSWCLEALVICSHDSKMLFLAVTGFHRNDFFIANGARRLMILIKHWMFFWLRQDFCMVLQFTLSLCMICMHANRVNDHCFDVLCLICGMLQSLGLSLYALKSVFGKRYFKSDI